MPSRDPAETPLSLTDLARTPSNVAAMVRLRHADIEQALQLGRTRAEIASALSSEYGLPISAKAFEIALYRLRRKSKKPQKGDPIASKQVVSGATTVIPAEPTEPAPMKTASDVRSALDFARSEAAKAVPDDTNRLITTLKERTSKK